MTIVGNCFSFYVSLHNEMTGQSHTPTQSNTHTHTHNLNIFYQLTVLRSILVFQLFPNVIKGKINNVLKMKSSCEDENIILYITRGVIPIQNHKKCHINPLIVRRVISDTLTEESRVQSLVHLRLKHRWKYELFYSTQNTIQKQKKLNKNIKSQKSSYTKVSFQKWF